MKISLIENPKAFLFDLDGTLVDSVPDIAAAMDAMLESLGFSPAGEEKARQWIGNGTRKLTQRALSYFLGCDESGIAPKLLDDAHKIFLTHYEKINGQHCRIYNGASEALAAGADKAIPMAIVTNKPIQFVPYLLEQLGIYHYFKFCIGGECVPNKKPDPSMLLNACERLQVAPQNSLMIGDSKNDVLAARRAGMPVVAVSYGYNHGRAIEMENPDAIIDDLRELFLTD